METTLFLKKRDTCKAVRVTAETPVPQDDAGLNVRVADVGDWLVTEVNDTPLNFPMVYSDAAFRAMYEQPRERAALPSNSIDTAAIASDSVSIPTIVAGTVPAPAPAVLMPTDDELRQQLAKELEGLGIDPTSPIGQAAIDKAIATKQPPAA